MERLTERDHHGDVYVKQHDYVAASERLAEYEDLEEQGLLLRLPCKVGDVVYAPLPNYEISVWRVKDISIGASYFDFLLVYAGDDEEYSGERFLLPINDISKTVFLTREEAERQIQLEALRYVTTDIDDLL